MAEKGDFPGGPDHLLTSSTTPQARANGIPHMQRVTLLVTSEPSINGECHASFGGAILLTGS
jgi:hypothetical protein